MNSRERVLMAFGRIEGIPDRVPLQFDLCKQLSDYFGKELGIPVHYTENLYEDVTYRISANELRIAMGSDVVIIGASVSDDYKIKINADGTWLNEYKMRMRQGSVYVEVIDYPLAHVETKADFDAYQFPDPDAPGRYRDAEALVKKYKNDYLIFGDIEVTVFSLAQQLVGMEKLLIDIMMEAEYVVPLFEACAEFQTQIGLRLIDKGVDAIWFGDDFGTQTSLIIPPETFREQLKPLYKRMVDRFKEANPDIIPILHCDGAVAELLDDIYEKLDIVKSISERYDGRLRDKDEVHMANNSTVFGTGSPFGEDECGDYYGRALSSWSVLLALQSFIYDGPQQTIGFNPVWQPENHSSFFSTSDAWGLFSQTRSKTSQTSIIDVKYGTAQIKTIVLAPPDKKTGGKLTVKLDGIKQAIESSEQNGNSISIQLKSACKINAGSKIVVSFGLR